MHNHIFKIKGLKQALATMRASRPHFQNKLRIQYIKEDDYGIDFAIVDYRHGSIYKHTYDDWMLYLDKKTESITINLLIKNLGYDGMEIIHNRRIQKEYFFSMFQNFKLGDHYEFETV